MEDELVTILTFNYPSEAYVIKARLESEGIRCFLQNENFYYKRFFSQTGVQLQVLSTDVEKAKHILQENDENFRGQQEHEQFEEGKNLGDLRRTSLIILVIIITVFLIFIFGGL